MDESIKITSLQSTFFFNKLTIFETLETKRLF